MSTYTVEALLKATGGSAFAKEFERAQNSVTNLSDVSSKLGDIGSSFQNVGKALTLGITAPVVAGVTAAVKSYADLEQAVGGIETLFKDSASKVIKNSESAYSRAGVSGVSYMEQVTSFSATLLQGLGGDTEKAAGYADKAIVDMSDNANKFGTDIGMVQNAYQGFAKDNFTMLDNLKLGYGGTAGEMARLVNESGVMGDSFEATAENVKEIPFDQLIEAIHKTQEEMGVTGTTAKEASETVSGSFGAMKAAAANLLAGLGDSSADIETLMSNLGVTIGNFATNIKGVLLTIWDNLPFSDFQKWVGLIIVAAGPILLAFGTVLVVIGQIGGAIAALPAILALLTGPVGIVIAVLAAVMAIAVLVALNFDKIKQSVMNMVLTIMPQFELVKATIMSIWETMKIAFAEGNFTQVATLFSTMIGFILDMIGLALPRLLALGLGMLTNLISGVTQKIPEFVAKGYELMLLFGQVLLEQVPRLIRIGADFVVSLLTGLGNNIPKWLAMGVDMVVKIANTMSENLPKIIQMGGKLLLSASQGFKDKFPEILAAAVTMVVKIIAKIIEKLPDVIAAGVKLILSIIVGIIKTIPDVLKAIANMADGIKDAVSDIDLLDAGKAIINGFIDGLKSTWESGKTFIGGIGGWIKDNKGPISYDKKLLVGAGNAIMFGLNKGLEDDFKKVKQTVGYMAGSIAESFNSSPVMSINGSIANSNAKIKSAVSHEINNAGKQPAAFTFNLGNRSFRAFVDDITNTQNAETQLVETYI